LGISEHDSQDSVAANQFLQHASFCTDWLGGLFILLSGVAATIALLVAVQMAMEQ
jgi:hypothetical protein